MPNLCKILYQLKSSLNWRNTVVKSYGCQFGTSQTVTVANIPKQTHTNIHYAYIRTLRSMRCTQRTRQHVHINECTWQHRRIHIVTALVCGKATCYYMVFIGVCSLNTLVQGKLIIRDISKGQQTTVEPIGKYWPLCIHFLFRT